MLFIGIDSDDVFYVLDEIYESGLTVEDIISFIFRFKKSGYFPTAFFCDPSQPASILAFNRAGLCARAGNNEISAGINKLVEMLQKNKLLINSKCVNLIHELESYRYAEKKDDRNTPEIPLDNENHALDALRYSVMGARPRRKFAIAGMR